MASFFDRFRRKEQPMQVRYSSATEETKKAQEEEAKREEKKEKEQRTKFEGQYGQMTDEQFSKVQEENQMKKTEALKRRLENIRFANSQRAYKKSAGAKISHAFGTIQNFGRPAGYKAYYKSIGQIAPTGAPQSKVMYDQYGNEVQVAKGSGGKYTAGGRKTIPGGGGAGKRGRPHGTLDPRYAKYGGVFQYRKWLSQQKRLAKIQGQGQPMQQQVPPQMIIPQQQYAQYAAQQKQRQQIAMEQDTFPDTSGEIFNMKKLQKEIDDATNIYD
jgi:hypothetical protein